MRKWMELARRRSLAVLCVRSGAPGCGSSNTQQFVQHDALDAPASDADHRRADPAVAAARARRDQVEGDADGGGRRELRPG